MRFLLSIRIYNVYINLHAQLIVHFVNYEYELNQITFPALQDLIESTFHSTKKQHKIT